MSEETPRPYSPPCAVCPPDVPPHPYADHFEPRVPAGLVPADGRSVPLTPELAHRFGVADPAQPYERLHEYEVTVTEVQDGDTLGGDLDLGFYFTMQGISVRFLGVDAPELTVTVDGRRVLNPAGEAATLVLLSLLGRERFAAVRSRGYFGRPGPYLLADGADPLKLLIRTELGSVSGTEKYGRVLADAWLPGEDPAVTPTLGARVVPDPATTT